jgi:hypothetical protein
MPHAADAIWKVSLSGETYDTNWYCLEVLTRAGDHSVLQDIERLVQEGVSAPITVLSELHNVADGAFAEKLTVVLTQSSSRSQWEAASAVLQNLLTLAAAPLLSACASHQSLRTRAGVLLVTVAGRQALKPPICSIDDPLLAVRVDAANAVVALGETAVPYLLMLVEDRETSRRTRF